MIEQYFFKKRAQYGKDQKELQMVLCFMPRKDSKLYSTIKYIAGMFYFIKFDFSRNLERKFGILTQCITWKSVQRANDQLCGMVLMKINAKVLFQFLWFDKFWFLAWWKMFHNRFEAGCPANIQRPDDDHRYRCQQHCKNAVSGNLPRLFSSGAKRTFRGLSSRHWIGTSFVTPTYSWHGVLNR